MIKPPDLKPMPATLRNLDYYRRDRPDRADAGPTPEVATGNKRATKPRRPRTGLAPLG